MFFGKNWQMTINVEISIFPKKRKAIWATLHMQSLHQLVQKQASRLYLPEFGV
jgi:hypothetical protein